MKYGTTEKFEAIEGINQNEIISLLVWRIIYDPLLCKLQQIEKGFEIKLEWPISAQEETILEVFRPEYIVYTDNTTLFTSSKENMQLIIEKAKKFYRLNDIEINLKKNRTFGSELKITKK